MTASEAEVGQIEVDAGDAPTFVVVVDPFGVDTAVTAALTDPAGVVTAFTMTGNATKETWTGTGPTLTTLGEYTAKFTIAGTGAGVKYHTVLVATPPPVTDELRRLRLLIADTDSANRLFRLDQLADFLAIEGGNLKLAAAQALDAVARSEVLVSKVLRKDDMATDGAKVAAELRASAVELRRQVADGDGDDAVGFDIVDFVDPWTRSSAELAESELP